MSGSSTAGSDGGGICCSPPSLSLPRKGGGNARGAVATSPLDLLLGSVTVPLAVAGSLPQSKSDLSDFGQFRSARTRVNPRAGGGGVGRGVTIVSCDCGFISPRNNGRSSSLSPTRPRALAAHKACRRVSPNE